MTPALCEACGNHARVYPTALCKYCGRKKKQWDRWRRIMIQRDTFPIYDKLSWTDYLDCWERVCVVRQL